MNFLQKGLAGLESRLDKVLLDESERQQPLEQPRRSTDSNSNGRRSVDSARRSVDKPPPAAAAAAGGAGGRMTMQERLAAAVAKKAGEGSGSGSRTGSPAPGRGSGESRRDEAAMGPPDPPGENGHADANGEGEDLSGTSREEMVEMVRRLRGEAARRGAESLAAEERIGALEEKVRFLTSDPRRKAAVSGGGGGGGAATDRKLSEAQEKIALLLEEGEKLSRNELKLRNTIKELRIKTQEEEKSTAEARKRAERAEKEAAETRERVKKAAEEARRDKERLKSVAKLEGELQALRTEKGGLLAAIEELNVKVEEGARRAEEAESKVQTEALESERGRNVELTAEVERLNVEVADLKSKISRDAERARNTEQELKAEQAVMERKMEALRARAEEVSSGASGDAHAKLLRQVETLQTQYAIASENWQGIEGSMLTRIAGLEKERDELTKKEADIRRKARDLSIKSKNLDMDLDTANSRIKDLESDLAIAQQTTSTLQTRLKTTENELSTLRSTFEHERTVWQRDLDTKLLEERQKWAHLATDSRPSSPLNLHHIQTLSATSSLPPIRKSSGPLSTTESYFLGATRKPSRSPSAEPPTATSTPTDHLPRRGFTTPPIGFSTPPPPPPPLPLSSRTSLPMPTAPEEDDTDYFDNIPFSPHRADMVSVSTVAAGPSVQLVERMSATVRRLESEMAGAREEVAAITAQRDEARREIVDLVREVEEGRGQAERVKGLEAEVAELRRREEAMLQLLGEKSELVEELKADVEDLKGMYRDLVSGYGK